MTLYARVKVFLEMIKFSHTIFALPFAFTGALLAAEGLPTLSQAGWIVLAMVGARTAAMGLNRVIDAEIDGRNPRTSGRAIPAGLLGRGAVLIFILLSVLLLLFAARALNPLCLYLSPVALGFILLYSYCKRFTALAHVVLGICLAGAPLGAWIAIRGSADLPAYLLALAVLFWVAGFDILYALQDMDFDRQSGLHSVPAKLGVGGSLRLSRIFHVLSCLFLAALYVAMGLGPFFLAGLVATCGMLLYEHHLLRGGNLDCLDAAFFNMNGYISVTLFVATLLDTLTSGAA
jgi:4-hydroxybenzoate polyprenyltransferase